MLGGGPCECGRQHSPAAGTGSDGTWALCPQGLGLLGASCALCAPCPFATAGPLGACCFASGREGDRVEGSGSRKRGAAGGSGLDVKGESEQMRPASGRAVLGGPRGAVLFQTRFSQSAWPPWGDPHMVPCSPC